MLSKFIFSQQLLDRIIQSAGIIALTGVAGIGIMLLNPKHGLSFLFSGFMLLSQAFYCLVFQHWRTEPGLWMLAALLVVIGTPSYLILTYERMTLGGLPQQRDWQSWRIWLDCGLALLLYYYQVRFAASVAWHNWQLTRRNRQSR